MDFLIWLNLEKVIFGEETLFQDFKLVLKYKFISELREQDNIN